MSPSRSRTRMRPGLHAGLIWVLAIGVVARGCIVEHRRSSAGEAGRSPVKSIRVGRALPGPIHVTLPFVGLVEPRRLVNAHFLVAGRVARCAVREGARVAAGEEICRLDDSAVSLELGRTRNAVVTARKVLETNLLEKQKALFEAGVIGQGEFEQVRLQSESARAQLADAVSVHELALKKQKEHVLVAPWDGVVSRLLVRPGQPASPELPAAILTGGDGVQIRTQLAARHFASLVPRISGTLTQVAGRSLTATLPLRLMEKSTGVQPSTQTFDVTLGVEKEDLAEQVGEEARNALIPGILVRGRLVLRELQGVPRVPEKSLLKWNENGEGALLVVDGDRLQERKVTLGERDEEFFEVKSGLAETDRFALDPAEGLSALQRVRIVEVSPGAERDLSSFP